MSRKYRQRGYQDEEPQDSQRGSRAVRQRPEGPRGRGLGKPTRTVFRCARCGAVQTAKRLGLESTCADCGSHLHTCTNCRYFDTGATNECRAEIEERVSSKASRNDCSLFEAKAIQESASDAPYPGDARSEFDALFDF